MATVDVPIDEKERIRVTLDMTPPMKTILDGLAQEAGTSQAEVLRRAVALLYAIKTAQKNGEGDPALVKNGQLVAKLIGF